MLLRKKKKILTPPADVKTISCYIENLEFTVFVYIRTEWDERQVSYLSEAITSQKMTSEEICKWCLNHKIAWQVIYPASLKTIIKNPYRYLRYKRLYKLDHNY